MVIKKENNGVFGQGKIEPWTHEEMIRYGKIAGIAVVIAVILFAGWMYYTSPALIPEQQANQGDQGGGVKSTPVPAGKEAVAAGAAASANSAAANQNSGQETTYIMGKSVNTPSKKFDINSLPAIISIPEENIEVSDLKITETKISATIICVKPNEVGNCPGSTKSSFYFQYWKNGKKLPAYQSIEYHGFLFEQKYFEAKRMPETIGADEVKFYIDN